jgi:hypothetical protein
MAAAWRIPRVKPVRITVGIAADLFLPRGNARSPNAHIRTSSGTTTFLELADAGDQVVAVLDQRGSWQRPRAFRRDGRGSRRPAVGVVGALARRCSFVRPASAPWLRDLRPPQSVREE